VHFLLWDFLSAHKSALRRAKSPNADTPMFVSLTSSADKATRYLHPVANVLFPLYPSLQHTYTNVLKVPTNETRRIHQSAFYNRAAGHQPLLVDHWLVDNGKVTHASIAHQSIIDQNLNYAADNPLEFLAAVAGKPDDVRRWRFSLQPPSKAECSGPISLGP